MLFQLFGTEYVFHVLYSYRITQACHPDSSEPHRTTVNHRLLRGIQEADGKGVTAGVRGAQERSWRKQSDTVKKSQTLENCELVGPPLW